MTGGQKRSDSTHIAPVFWQDIVHIVALSVGESGSGGKESALFRLGLLTQTERKQYKSTGSLTRVTAVGNWEDF